MRYFDYDESDESAQQEVEEFFNEVDNTDKYMHMQHIGLESQKVNRKILDSAIRTCEKSFFWMFYSSEKKMSVIYDTYFGLLNLVNEGE